MGIAKEINAQKIEEDETLRKMKKQEVAAMEALEMELINKLNNTVALQKQAYDDLEKALNSPGKTKDEIIK